MEQKSLGTFSLPTLLTEEMRCCQPCVCARRGKVCFESLWFCITFVTWERAAFQNPARHKHQQLVYIFLP